MPFGLTGVPAAWQRCVNDLLCEYLDEFFTADADDVLNWNDGTKDDHCRSFANFYRDFIEEFASSSTPLQRYIKKEFSGKGRIQLDDEARQAFEKLKELFVTARILALFDPELKTVLETDCSGWAMGVCLSQWDSPGKLRPIGYFSKKLSPCECNYDIHDKELLAIVCAVEFWPSELMSLKHKLEILTDHKNLQYFSTKRTLSERQIRWKSILDSLPDIKLHYRPGKEASWPDALSRLEQDTPKDLGDPVSNIGSNYYWILVG
ncbi:hypothetical protein K3495_g8763 [Podosphaera aphanis]|nr:hypothetical protein K3495_g8763 [Podosphaera aphanis]